MNISRFHFTCGKNMIIPVLIKHKNTSPFLKFCITTDCREIYLYILTNALKNK